MSCRDVTAKLRDPAAGGETIMRVVMTCMLGAAIALGGCAREPELPELAAIYARVAEAGAGAARRPLVTIPGTLGSRLVDSASGTVVWGAGGSRGLSADPESPEEARLIALPILRETDPLGRARDGVIADGVLDRAAPEVFGIPIDIEVYGGVLRTLSAGGFRTATRANRAGLPMLRHGQDEPVGAAPRAGSPAAEDEADLQLAATGVTGSARATAAEYARLVEAEVNSFRFDYDWRRDLPQLAAEFHSFLMLRRRQVAAARSLSQRRSVSPSDVKFDLLAHSMGGLIARYYLMYGSADLPEDGSLPPITWAGAQHFSRVVIVATPNAGSILAMDNVVNGKSLGPLQPFYPPALLATHASVWQLMPRTRHGRVRERASGAVLDLFDPGLWERNGWGVHDPEAEPMLSWLMPEEPDPELRRARAAAHQARLIRRAEHFHRAMDRWAPKPRSLEMYLVVGGGFATPATGEVDPATGAFEITEREEGDGVVLRSSVLLDERQGQEGLGGLKTPLRFDTTLFLPDEHVALTKNPVFGDNLLFWLLEQPRDSAQLAEPRRGLLGSTSEGAEPAPRPAAPQASAGAER